MDSGVGMEERVLDSASIDRRRLDNGITAIVRVDRSAPVVAIVTHLRVGYFNEPDHLAGISHVLEHMFFKGTPTRGPGAIAQETKAAGGLLNAATIYDYTNYYTILPSASLEQGLAIQSDALLNSLIDADELRRELQVIIQEARRKLDNPSAVASEKLYELMFDLHRMRRWRIGTEEFLNNLTRDQLHAYYRDMYRGEAVVLVVAGDVDAERTHQLIAQYYGELERGSANLDHGPTEPARHEFRFAERAGDIVQSYIELGWRTTPTLHADTAALDVLAVVLGQGRASRLYRTVREAGLVNSIRAGNYTPTVLGVFQIGIELEPHNALAALRAIAATVEGVRAGVAAEEVERARSILEARLLRRLESMDGQANFLAEWEALGDWQLGEEYLRQVTRVTADDVRAAAERYLQLESAAIFSYHPNDAGALALSSDALLKELRAVDRVSVTPAPVAVRPSARAQAKRERAEDGVQEFHTPNGLRIFVKPRASAPLVSLAYAVPGGANSESLQQASLTALTARSSIKGTRNRTSFELALASEALGASISPSVSSDTLDWYTSVPSKHLEAALDLVADVALNPSFPDEDVEREKQIALADLQQVRDDMYRYPLRLFLETAFARHPYGFSLEASSNAVAAANAGSLRDWHAQLVTAEPAVFIVGDVDAEHAAEAAAHFFTIPAAQRRSAAQPAWPQNGGERVEQRAKAQTALVLGYPAVDRNHPDLFPLQVLANAIAGLGGRLFEELRSKKSLAYTVTAYPIARQLGGAFVTYIATAPEREDEATSSLLEEIDRVRQTLLPDDDVERAKRYMIGSWQIRAQTNGAQLTDLVNALLIGPGLSELREYEDRVRAVTAAQIRDAAQRYLLDDKMVRAVVRGAARS